MDVSRAGTDRAKAPIRRSPRPAASRPAAAWPKYAAVAGGLAAAAVLGGLLLWPAAPPVVGTSQPEAASVAEAPAPGPAEREPAGRAAPEESSGPAGLIPGGFVESPIGGSVGGGRVVLASMVEPERSFDDAVGPFLSTYCGDCHGPDYAEAEIDVASVRSADDLRADREQWERILAIVRVGAMPPSESDQPSAADRSAAVDWIDRVLHEVNCEVDNDPGRVTVRRLNRAEYDNTVRDLLGVDLTLSDAFPADDVGDGFDNQGEILSLPPLLMEKYLAAAERASQEAIVGDVSSLLATSKEYGGRSIQSHSESFEFPQRGDYTIRIRAAADQAGQEKARYTATLAGIPLAKTTVRAEGVVETFERTVPVKAGRHKIEVKFLNDYYRPDAPGGKQDRNLRLESIEVVGPLGTRPDDLPDSHEAIVVATPEEAGGVKNAAEAIFGPFASRAFRRPATELEVQRLASLVESVVRDGRTFEQGVQLGVQAVLCSPHFLFRIERDPANAAAGEAVGLSDYELASRLSYFLWASTPDEELLELAERGELGRKEVLSAQVDRLLDDPRSEGLMDGFFAQWLNLPLLEEAAPDRRVAGPWWSESTRQAMRRETELLCEEVVRKDLPVSTFLTADFTYVNPRLAEFYGIPWEGKTGDAMLEYYSETLPKYIKKDGGKLKVERRRRAYPYRDEEKFVRVPAPRGRRGVLTHGSILALTSNPVGTSPVKRGKWILDNILGAPPPPAPPNVPALEDTQAANKNLSLREALAKHREDPGCASCHAVMDPLGFAFEHFDAVGRYRTKDGKHAVDASGELPDGSTFANASELIDVLEGRSEEFVTHFTRQLMTFALGRGMQWYDRCAVDAVVASAAADGHRFRDLVRGIVLSDPFRKRSAEAVAAR